MADTPMKAVKAKCIECCGGSIHEAKKCHINDCPLWNFRPGTRRRQPRTMSAEQRQAVSERFAAARAAKQQATKGD